MYKNIFLYFLSIICIISVSYADKKKPIKNYPIKSKIMDEKWNRLYHLIDKERKTIKSVKRLNSRLKYRLFELYTEELDLIKQKENKLLLKADPIRLKKYGKKSFFKNSLKHYRFVKKYGLNIIKQYPRLRYKGQIYYTMALNSRDYAGDKETEKFLKLALSFSQKNEVLKHNAYTSLSEHYYNKKKYKKAIRYYKIVIRNKEDPWYSKHLYNLSWCYLKAKQHRLAIDFLKLSFSQSKNKKYIDVQDQALNSGSIFFVHGSEIKEGVTFYLENTKFPYPYLIKMAKGTTDKGLFKETEYIIDLSLRNAITKKDRKGIIDIRLGQLEIYRSFSKYNLFFQTANHIDKIHTEKPLNEEEKEDATFKIQSLVGFLQIKLSENAKKNIKKYNRNNYNNIIRYFDILINLNPHETDRYKFYQGETSFGLRLFVKAFLFYKEGVVFSRSLKKENKWRRKLMDSLLAAISEGNFSKNIRKDNLLFAYVNHLYFWPKDDRSRKIYPMLSAIYMTDKRDQDSLKNIYTYIKYYPEDIKEQRSLITNVIDHYIITKDINELSKWVKKLTEGYLKFDQKFIEDATTILGKISFEGYQNLEDKGNKLEAAKGYSSLYHDERFPNIVKSKAAFRASVLYSAQTDTKNSYNWAVSSLKLMPEKEYLNYWPRFETLINQFVEMNDFKSSLKLSNHLYNITCTSNIKLASKINLRLFNHMIDMSVSLQSQKSILSLMDKSIKCNIPENNLKEQLLFSLYIFSGFNGFQNSAHLFEKALTKYPNEVISLVIQRYWDNFGKNRSHISSFMKKYKNQIKKLNMKDDFQSQSNLLKQSNVFFNELKTLKKYKLNTTKQFNEENFNNELSSLLDTLKSITKNGDLLIKSKRPEVILNIYKTYLKSYSYVINEITNFTPQGVPKEFVNGFKKHMAGLVRNLTKAKNNYQKDFNKILNITGINADGARYYITPNYQINSWAHPAKFYSTQMDLPKSKL